MTVITGEGSTSYKVEAGSRGPVGATGATGPAGSAATVDQTIIDGSTNAVAGNAVFDALALKAPLASPTFTGTVTAPHIHGSIAGNLYVHVRNTSGGTLTKGTPIYITGNVGTAGNEDRVTVAAADNTNPAKMPAVALLGSDLANNGDGNGIIVGELMNLNIPSYSINQELYVGAGAIATTKPTTGEVQSVGVVSRINTNTGIIVVNMQGRRDAAATAATANTLALRDATGGANFAAVGASSVTASGEISTTSEFGFICTAGQYATISTAGANASISTQGANAEIYTGGSDATISTSGASARIFTTGSDATISTTGSDAAIFTDGANAFIQSRSTFKLYDGTYTTTLSHSPTADRAIAFPNKAGTVAMVDAETHTGAHAFSSTTRPTSAGTGTPAATSLITTADGDARYGGPFYDLDGSASHSESSAITPVKTVVLPVGTYLIEYAKLAIAHSDTASRTININVNFTGGTATMQDRSMQAYAQSGNIAGLTYTGQGATLANAVAITNASPSFGGGAHFFSGRIVVTAQTTFRIFGFCSVTPTNAITYETSGILRKIA